MIKPGDRVRVTSNKPNAPDLTGTVEMTSHQWISVSLDYPKTTKLFPAKNVILLRETDSKASEGWEDLWDQAAKSTK